MSRELQELPAFFFASPKSPEITGREDATSGSTSTTCARPRGRPAPEPLNPNPSPAKRSTIGLRKSFLNGTLLEPMERLQTQTLAEPVGPRAPSRSMGSVPWNGRPARTGEWLSAGSAGSPPESREAKVTQRGGEE